jgi:hypothetical protein
VLFTRLGRRWLSFYGLLELLHRDGQLKGRLLDGFANYAFLQAPGANTGVARRAIGRRYLHALQIRLELTPRNAGHFRPDAAQVFGFPAVLDLIAHAGLFLAILTLRHRLNSLCRLDLRSI